MNQLELFLDKLSQAQLKQGTTGTPLVTEHAISKLEAEVKEDIDSGIHTIFVGDVVSTDLLKDGRSLT